MQSITPEEFADLVKAGMGYPLLDVREQDEFDESNLRGQLVPLGDIEEYPHSLNEILKDEPLIVHCRSGKRSASAIDPGS